MTTDKKSVDLNDLLTPDELCELFQVPKSWVYRQVREGDIPCLHLGKYLRFPRAQIEEWIRQCQVNR